MIYNNDFLLPLTLEFYHKRLIISAQMAPNKPIILTCDQIKHVSEEGSLGTKIVNVGYYITGDERGKKKR